METQSLVKSGGKLFKSLQLFVIAGTVLMTMVVTFMCIGFTVRYEVNTDTVDTESIAYWKEAVPPEQEVWFEKGVEELRLATKFKKSHNGVKNVMVFVAQGVTSDMLARARFRKSNNATDFVWDSFPYVGTLRSSCGYTNQCDLFTLGTSLFGGVKTITGLGALDERVEFQNCSQAVDATYHIESVFQQAQKAKLRTGLVTTQRVTGPLLSALYAQSADTKWECDAAIPKHLRSNTDCLDVATQLMIGHTGQSINAIMGGGKQTLVSRLSNDSEVDVSACDSKDKRNLLQEWKYLKLESDVKFKLLETPKELDKLKGQERDYVFGVFANGDLPPETPKLKRMVMKMLDVLKRNNTGYIAVAETAVRSKLVGEFEGHLQELDEVIRGAFEHPGYSPKNTLVLVTFMDLLKSDDDTTLPEDILVYATGPNSHLFHKVHGATYMAHAIAYSLKIGVFNSKKSRKH